MKMDELTQMPSRLGQISTAIAVFDFIVLGALIIVRMNISNDWMDTEDFARLERTANWVLAGNLSIIIFPVVAIIGLIIGAFGYFQPNYSKFYSTLGMALNGFCIVGWIIGMIGYQIIFHSDRFYVK